MYSDPNTMASALFAKASSAGMDYIQGNIQRYVAHVPQMHQHMQQSVVKMWDNFKDSQIGRKAEAIRHKLNNFWKDDSIHYQQTVGDVQQSRTVMARWNMANPSVRELYHDGRIAGYGEHYIDNAPGVSGREHYDYRKATEGVVLGRAPNEDGNVGDDYYTNHYEKNLELEAVLSHMDKAAINLTWAVIEEELEESNADPTSEWNDTRG